MPLVMLVLLFTFVLLVLGVRTRRATAGLGMAAFVISLLALVIVTAARFTQHDAYTASYEWLNLGIAVSGNLPFQNFMLDLDLRIDHFAIAEVGTILAVGLLVLAWSRSGARAEAGVPRLHILVVLFVLGGVGVALTPNLAGLAAYWGVAAAATYLMFSNRWGTVESGAGRWSLGLPIAGDVAVLLGIALLYSRYGELDLGRLPGVVPTSLAAGQKSLTAACILIVAGAAARAAFPPLQGWLTSATAASPAASAAVQGVWALLAGGLVFRVLPLIHLAGWQASFSLAVLGGLGAIGGGALALAGNGLRRAVTGAGIASAGLGFMGLAYGDAAHALTGLLAAAPLRAGMLLAAASIATAMRSEDLAEMGAALRRMPWSALALLLGALGMPLAYAQAGAIGLRPPAWSIVFAVGLALVALAGLRPYFGAAHGVLERRRAFEPARVREAVSPLPQVAVLLTVFGLVYVLLSAVNRWSSFVVFASARRPALTPSVEFLGAVAVGVVIATMAYGRGRTSSLRWSARAGAGVEAARLRLLAGAERLVLAPLRAGSLALDDGLPGAETDALAPALMAGRLANRAADAELPVGWVALAVGIAAVGAILAAVLSPGVIR